VSSSVKKYLCRAFAAVIMAGMWALPVAVLAGGCAAPKQQRLAEGTGAVVGEIKARPHKDYLKKAKDKAQDSGLNEGNADSYGSFSSSGKIVYNETMVNYGRIEVYAILLNPAAEPGNRHEVKAKKDGGLHPEALAVAKGDIIHIKNESTQPLTFFLADINGGDIQDVPELAPGDSADMTVELVGDLELATDEDERLSVAVLSREGLQSRRIQSGSSYEFLDVPPGEYDLLFWYWRLGSLNQKVTIVEGQRTQVDGVLSVDTIVR